MTTLPTDSMPRMMTIAAVSALLISLVPVSTALAGSYTAAESPKTYVTISDGSTSLGGVNKAGDETSSIALASTGTHSTNLLGRTSAAETESPEDSGAIVGETDFLTQTDAMASDILRNPAYSDATKVLLLEQLENDFQQFDQIGTTESGFELKRSGGSGLTYQTNALRLSKVALQDPYTRGIAEEFCSSSDPCALPLEYNMMPPLIHLTWTFRNEETRAIYEAALAGDPSTDLHVVLDEIVQIPGERESVGYDIIGGGYTARYEPIDCGPSVPAPCLEMAFSKNAWFKSSPPWASWSIRVEAWSLEPLGRHELGFDRFGNPYPIRKEWVMSESATARVSPLPVIKDYFTATIAQSIMSDRCTSCHALDSPAEIAAEHSRSGVASVSAYSVEDIPSAIHENETIYGCVSCHDDIVSAVSRPLYDFDETRWATPPASMDINWGKIIEDHPNTWSREVCNRIVANLPSHSAREHHFKEDGRLFWAVQSGLTPHLETLPTSLPQNYVLFIKHFEAWNDAGARCP